MHRIKCVYVIGGLKMFNYYNSCFVCVPVPLYFKNTKQMIPIQSNSESKHKPQENDEDLKALYPKIYFRIYPLVKQHCDMMEKEKGQHHCPSKKRSRYCLQKNL